MTVGTFRRLALQAPGAIESAHMNHPDFRLRGRIFATLGPAGSGLGMVRLTPAQQRRFIARAPGIFFPCSGTWGRQGCTHVRLASARVGMVGEALALAWRNLPAGRA